MQRRRYTKIALRIAAVLAALLLGMTALSVLEHRRTQRELGAALSDFFSERLLREIPDSAPERAIQVVLLREGPITGRGGPAFEGWRARWSNLRLDRQLLFPQASRVTRSSFLLSNLVLTDMRAELQPRKGLEFIVVSRSEILWRSQPDDFEGRFPNNFGFFGVSQAGFNSNKTEAMFYIDHYCGGLCGGGEYVLMRKVNGVWKVVDQRMTWVS